MHGMRDCPRSTVSTDWRDNLKALARQDFKVSISIDVERDYRLDGRITTRGVDEGLPVYFDLLRSHRIPCDLFVSGEVASEVASLGLSLNQSLVALGCHGFNHPAGPASYLSRKSDHVLKRELATATSIIRSSRVSEGAVPRYWPPIARGIQGSLLSPLTESRVDTAHIGARP